MEEEVIALEVDISGAEEGLERFTDTVEDLREVISGIGDRIVKAIEPALKCFEQMQKSASTLNDTLAATNTAIQAVSAQLGNLQMAAVTEEMGAAADMAMVLAEAMAGAVASIGLERMLGSVTISAKDMLSVLVGVLKSPIGIAGAVVAAVAAVVAAIIVYWDEISAFFTQTIPKLWSQFTQWIGDMGNGLAGFCADAGAWLGNVGSVVSGALAAAWSSVSGFFTDCRNGITAVWANVGQWFQDNVVQPVIDAHAPLLQWFGELFQSVRRTVEDVVYNINVLVAGCKQVIQTVWSAAVEWLDSHVIQPVAQFFTGLWVSVRDGAVNIWNQVKEVLGNAVTWIYQKVIQPVGEFLAGVWSGFVNGAMEAWEGIKAVFSKLGDFMKNVFSNAWQGVLKVFSTVGEVFTNIKDAILTSFIKIVNGLISGLNAVIAVPFNGINTALSAIKNINILGMTPFSGLRAINVPQIPYLARGAVLPANRPFLAVVGDQRHGTNVEAPLATIQEAVAVVMENHISAMMAGFQALLEEQQALRQCVEGIEIGDDVIGQATARYNRKMAVVRGGY